MSERVLLSLFMEYLSYYLVSIWKQRPWEERLNDPVYMCDTERDSYFLNNNNNNNKHKLNTYYLTCKCVYVDIKYDIKSDLFWMMSQIWEYKCQGPTNSTHSFQDKREVWKWPSDPHFITLHLEYLAADKKEMRGAFWERRIYWNGGFGLPYFALKTWYIWHTQL